jgi:dystonin
LILFQRDLLVKASNCQHELEEALSEANKFTTDIQKLIEWLGDLESEIASIEPVGDGLKETASEQLAWFMGDVCDRLIKEDRPKVETLLAQGQEYIKRQSVKQR